MQGYSSNQVYTSPDRPEKRFERRDQDLPVAYKIIVSPCLSRKWENWFEGFEMSDDTQGRTHLQGMVVDQAALYGILNKIRDLNLLLILVQRGSPVYLEEKSWTGEGRQIC